MKKKKITLLLIIISLVAYNFLFWGEQLALNLFLFSTFLTGFIFFLYPETKQRKGVIMMDIGMLLTGLMVLFHNTTISKFAHIISFIVLTGFVQQKALRSLIFAFPTALGNYVLTPVNWWEQVKQFKGTYRGKKVWRWLKLILFPLIAVYVFYWLYKLANPVFDQYTEVLWQNILESLNVFLNYWSWGRIFYLLLGGFIISGALLYRPIKWFANKERSFSDRLQRKRKTQPVHARKKKAVNKPPFRSFTMLALKTEYKMGLLLLGLMNTLLLIVNMIDIEWLWFDFSVPAGFNLSQFVHEGTYLLLLSILLAMLLLLYYFRANLNFYSRNKWLKYGAYFWIFQNGVMVISVALRNYYYIQHYGLTYKRIGVFLFLLMTLTGLVTLLLKIKKVRSIYYLLRVNTWAAYVLLISVCLVNWDMRIAQYNLNTEYPAQIDRAYLLNLSDKTLPVLYKHKAVFEHIDSFNLHKSEQEKQFLNQLAAKRQEMLTEYKTHSWLSWNYTDWHNYQCLKKQSKQK